MVHCPATRKINVFRVASVYVSPSVAEEAILPPDLARLLRDDLDDGSPLIVAGDFNAHHPLWSSSDPNPAGSSLHRIMMGRDWDFGCDEDVYISTFLCSGVAKGRPDLTVCRNSRHLRCTEIIGLFVTDHIPTISWIEITPGHAPPGRKRRFRSRWQFPPTSHPMWSLYRDECDRQARRISDEFSAVKQKISASWKAEPLINRMATLVQQTMVSAPGLPPPKVHIPIHSSLLG